MGDIANKGEAERCRELAKEFLARKQYEKSIRFLNKSLSLYPLPGVKELRMRIEALEEQNNRAAGIPSSSSSSNSGKGSGSTGSGGDLRLNRNNLLSGSFQHTKSLITMLWGLVATLVRLK